jgi:cytidyltransferase-like protein
VSRHESTSGSRPGFLTRVLRGRPRRVALVSGGFDPVHSGHVRMILEAARYGEVQVILNSDEWLARKKGRPFMDWGERAAVVGAIRGVSHVHLAEDEDGTVARTIQEVVELERLASLRPVDVTFCNGGDRVQGTTPEEEACRRLDVRMAWGVGGGKTQSSSVLLRNYGLSPSPP